MLPELSDNKNWKQINFRNVVTALGIEFLHDLYNQYDSEINCLRFRNTVVICKGKQVTSYAKKEDWDYLSKWFGERFIRGDKDLWERIDNYIKDKKERLHNVLKKIEQNDLKSLDNIALGLLLQEFHYTVLNTLYRINRVQIEHALNHAIKQMCEKFFPDCSERNKAIPAVLFSEEPTTGVEEEKSFLGVILKGQELNVKDPSENQEILSKIVSHYNKYRYVHCAYGEKPYDLEYYVIRYKELSNLGQEFVKSRLNEIDANNKSMVEKRNFYLKQLNEDPILVENIKLMTRIGSLRDRDKAMLGKTVAFREILLNSISERTGVPIEKLNSYFLRELCELLSEGKVLPDEDVEDRKNGIIICRKEYFTTSNKEDFCKCISEDCNHITGVCASAGKVVGTVKVVNKGSDANKVNQGDIMVAPGTDFDMINSMQKSAGIITEEGGILSHASVVCRELGIPCLISVDNATKRLKDGDVIELDCNNEKITKMEVP
jgi:phosphohistidine swiveling domain-containing protein